MDSNEWEEKRDVEELKAEVGAAGEKKEDCAGGEGQGKGGGSKKGKREWRRRKEGLLEWRRVREWRRRRRGRREKTGWGKAADMLGEERGSTEGKR